MGILHAKHSLYAPLPAESSNLGEDTSKSNVISESVLVGLSRDPEARLNVSGLRGRVEGRTARPSALLLPPSEGKWIVSSFTTFGLRSDRKVSSSQIII
jgi:hypothetical protein